MSEGRNRREYCGRPQSSEALYQSRHPIWSPQSQAIMDLSPLKEMHWNCPDLFFLGVVANRNNIWLCCGGICGKSRQHKEKNRLKKKEGLALSRPIHVGYSGTLLKIASVYTHENSTFFLYPRSVFVWYFQSLCIVRVASAGIQNM